MRQRLTATRRSGRRRAAPRPATRDGRTEPALIGLQRAAGNAAVTALVQRSPDAKEPDFARLDSIDAEESVRAFDELRLDGASIRAVQDALGTPSTGSFGVEDARALSRYQVARGLRRGGTYDWSRF